jgi:hypothetical protein
MVSVLIAIYVAGAVLGVIGVDGTLTTRVGIALLWPLGLLAFILTVAMLILVAAIAFPAFGVALVALLAATVLLLR